MGKNICNIFNSQKVTIQNMKDVRNIKMENSEKNKKRIGKKQEDFEK